MKRVRRGFAALAAVFAIALGSIGFGAEPADATYLPALTWSQPVSWFGCTGWYRYGNFGLAFSEAAFSGDNCSGYSGGNVVAYKTGFPNRNKFCNLIDVFPLSTANCDHITQPAGGVRSSINGTNWTAAGGYLDVCSYGAPVPYSHCLREGFGFLG